MLQLSLLLFLFLFFSKKKIKKGRICEGKICEVIIMSDRRTNRNREERKMSEERRR